MIPILIVFFCFGLIIGSFLNAVLWRMKEGIGLGGRSMCPKCRKKIAWYDNVPVISFFALGGKCRHCRKKISWRYPTVEVVTAVLYLLIGQSFFQPFDTLSWVLTAYYLVIVPVLLLIFLYDFDTMTIPDILLWIGVGWSLLLFLSLDALRFQPAVNIFSLRLYSGIAAGLGAFLPLFLLSALSRERWMGLGDGFLAFLLGLVLGFPNILFGMTLGFCLGAVWGVGLIMLGKKEMKSRMPLGPFLIAGALSILFLSAWSPNWFAPWFFVGIPW